jgi:hypothetical protein
MSRARRSELEARARRAQASLYAAEEEAARLRRQLQPSNGLHQTLDWISAWVSEARQLHRLAERELSKLDDRRTQ